MRTWLLIVAAALLPAGGSSGSYSIRNPATRNPVGTSTVPVSSIRSGLLPTLAPIDTTAELSITGNVRGGKHFRGNVPYRSITDIGLDPGTSFLNSYRTAPSLSSFLRDSAGPEDFDRRSSRYRTRPYYSPTETVATTVPGQPRIFSPPVSGILGGAQQGRLPTDHLFALESLPTQQTALGAGATEANSESRPLRTRYDLRVSDSLSTSDGTFVGESPQSLWDAGRLTPGEAAIRRQDVKLATQRLREQNLRSLLETYRESSPADKGAAADDMKSGLKVKTRSRSVADAGDRAATGYRLFPPETSMPLVYPALQQGPAEPRGTIGPQLPKAPPMPTLGVQESFMSSQAEETVAGPGSASLPQGGLSWQVAPGSAQAASGAEQGDVMERIRQRLDDLSISVERHLQAEHDGADQTTSLMPAPESYQLRSGNRPYVGGSGETLRPYKTKGLKPSAVKEMLTPARSGAVSGKVVDYSGHAGFASPSRLGLDVSRTTTSSLYPSSTLSPAEISGRAAGVMGSPKNIQSLSDDKFNRHMGAAEDYLRAGKYYKAADSFALALIYGPDNPQALLGRSHALFAAGEYVSSALFLSRALAIRPDYAKSKIDLVTLLGGRSRLAGRIGDLEQWSARSGSPRLRLLLGYVYFQIGRLDEATKAIEGADAKMPESAAIAAAKAAIASAAR